MASQLTINADMIALGVKQPWAELIISGRKTLEVRSTATNIRGTILIYTSQKPATESFARLAFDEFSLTKEDMDYGLLIGTVEIEDSRPAKPSDHHSACVPSELLKTRYVWKLSRPSRFEQPVRPRFLPYGVWFYPFKRREQQ